MAKWVAKLLGTWREPLPIPEDTEPSERRDGPERELVDEAAGVFWVDRNGVDHFEMARVRDRSKSGAGLTTKVKFVRGQQLWIDFRDVSTKAVVKHSRKNGHGFNVGLRLVPSERRREERQPVEGSAIVHWSDGVERFHFPVQMRDATQAGLQFAAKEPIPVDTPLRIEGDNMVCIGVTCHCTRDKAEYLVGVHLSGPPRRIELVGDEG